MPGHRYPWCFPFPEEGKGTMQAASDNLNDEIEDLEGANERLRIQLTTMREQERDRCIKIINEMDDSYFTMPDTWHGRAAKAALVRKIMADDPDKNRVGKWDNRNFIRQQGSD
jgi:TolA-binding protein